MAAVDTSVASVTPLAEEVATLLAQQKELYELEVLRREVTVEALADRVSSLQAELRAATSRPTGDARASDPPLETILSSFSSSRPATSLPEHVLDLSHRRLSPMRLTSVLARLPALPGAVEALNLAHNDLDDRHASLLGMSCWPRRVTGCADRGRRAK